MSGFASIRMWVIGWIAGLMLFTYSFPVGEVINKVVTTIPHDDKCFTQRLVYDEEGNLYESCGLYGKSSLRIVDRQSEAQDSTVP